MSLLRSSLGAWKSALPPFCTPLKHNLHRHKPAYCELSLHPPPTIHCPPARSPTSCLSQLSRASSLNLHLHLHLHLPPSTSPSPPPPLHLRLTFIIPTLDPRALTLIKICTSPIYALYLGNLISATLTSQLPTSPCFLPLLPSSIPRLSRIGASAGTSSESLPVKR
ncbi:uncharacterized protein RAG0_15507 [Rhynchosporium agropyri]|uniref:Uncharacterized protein n=1 Tax=Rhynchosporium agropyri TaxID=914238 RepID=A0A1E1LLE8_9HELO|nr:uncharacterized protein RAG0_15507 [Rhynchosporium agropyri]